MFARAVICVCCGALALAAQSAVLECTGDAVVFPRGKEAFVMQFRMGPVANVKVAKAKVILHVASGPVEDKVEMAIVERSWTDATATTLKAPTSWRPVAVTKQPKGWVSVEVPQGYAQALVQGRAYGLMIRGAFRPHERESGQYAPYLNVEGSK